MKENKNLDQIIIDLAEPLVQAAGLEIWGLEIIGGPRTKVCLYIDLPLGAISTSPAKTDYGLIEGENFSANIDQCENISRELGLALEVQDPITTPWVLEVSSPGLERKFFHLEQMKPYVGDLVVCRLIAPLAGQEESGRKVWRGRLVNVGEDFFDLDPCSISNEGKIARESLPGNIFCCHIPWKQVRNVSRLHVFTTPRKPGKRVGKTSVGK